MNKNIEQLAAIAAKKTRRIIGLMSGTSLDGLDIAVCKMEGAGFETKIQVEHFETVPYNAAFKNELTEICFKENISLQKLTLLNKYIGEFHAELINHFLADNKINNASIDLIASHGQTVYHAPYILHGIKERGNATLQIGDGDHLAVKTGIITISDFRQKNIAGGGEGAPLAAYGDLLLFSEKENDVLMLNIGGISNFTLLRKGGGIICSDIGPGNTLMDQTVRKYYSGKYFDENAEIASAGKINTDLLAALKDHPFVNASFPKTTGPELFNLGYLDNALKRTGNNHLSPEDKLATLNKFTADLITDAIKKLSAEGDCKIYVSGGGAENPLLMQHLKESLSCPLLSTKDKGIDPDAKEAVLFAVLANETVAGNTGIFRNISADLPAVSMGKICFPY